MRNKLLGCLYLFFIIFSVYSNPQSVWDMLNKSGVYENYEIRQMHQAVLQSKSFEAVDAPKRVFSQSESHVNVRFEVRKTANAYYLMFINQYEDRFPVWSSGTYIVKKDLETGEYIQVKVFLYNNEDSFIRMYPEQDRTRLDFYLFGNMIYSGVRIPLPFDKVVLMPLSEIINLTSNKIPWTDLFSNSSFSEWRDVERFSKEIQSIVPSLGDSDDGAMNELGEYVYIETLQPQVDEEGFNCSGFSKWVVDLQYKNLTGEFLPIEPLKEKHYDLRGNSWTNRAEEDRDPFFGLDWTRNLAYYYRNKLYPTQKIDFLSSDINSTPYFKYKDNVGYDVKELEAVLFIEAIKNPGRIYLGSVNTPFGTENVLRQHVHVVVLFPYFDKNSTFKVDVIERQTVTGVDSLKERYKGEFIHLVYIDLNNRSY
ncbi:MAG: hypothetical protein JXR64_09265 [Spirochaetales bacterium]|nr:hypothetical protein [Spirochaetales bacterium]